MAEIPLTQGKVALVDDADLPLIGSYAWWAGKRYALTTWNVLGSGCHGQRPIRVTVSMHELIMGGAIGVDHKNGNGLDNRRENLRRCTQSQNLANMRKHRGVSRYKGVVWDSSRGRWKAQMKHQGPCLFLGRYDSEVDAARAYNAAALRLNGEFARLNVIEAEP